MARLNGPDRLFCSREHLEWWKDKKLDWMPEEDELILAGGKCGGEYLRSIGVTDLAALDKQQWLMFLRACFGYVAEHRKPVTDELNDDIPF